jgi:hypothetical protein
VSLIDVRQGYSGTLPEGIGIGSSIDDVERSIGMVEEDMQDNLIVVGYPGWCFDTEVWTGHRLADSRNAKITEIFVFRPSQ